MLDKLPANIVVQSEISECLIAVGKSPTLGLFNIVVTSETEVIGLTVNLQFLSDLNELLTAHFEHDFKDLEHLEEDY